MTSKQKSPPPPRSKAVDDEDPDYSPMDDATPRKKGAVAKPKAKPEDMPGAAGLISARADEDTYD